MTTNIFEYRNTAKFSCQASQETAHVCRLVCVKYLITQSSDLLQIEANVTKMEYKEAPNKFDFRNHWLNIQLLLRGPSQSDQKPQRKMTR